MDEQRVARELLKLAGELTAAPAPREVVKAIQNAHKGIDAAEAALEPLADMVDDDQLAAIGDVGDAFEKLRKAVRAFGETFRGR